MKCPGCKKETHRFYAMTIEGKDCYCCPSCEKKAPAKLQARARRGRTTSGFTRQFEKFEVPRSERVSVKDIPHPSYPDSPQIRDAVRCDAPKRRERVMIGQYGMPEGRAELAMKKLSSKLGPNPRIISDDGLTIVGEAA